VVPLFNTTTFTITVTNTGGNALPADNSQLTVTLPPGLTAAGPLTFTVGPLGAGQSRTFTATATAAALGPQTGSATVTSPDASPASVTKMATISVQALIPNANVPAGTPLSAPFANLVTIKTAMVHHKGKKFIQVTIINNTADGIMGRLVLFGFTRKKFHTGLTFEGAPALDIILVPNGTATMQVPFVKHFAPLVVAGS
jgi:uncharacterized repeat protein (TIGR01451 family)